MAALYNFGQPNIVTLSVFGLPNTLLTCLNNTVSIIDFYDSQNYNSRFMGEIYPGEHRKVPERTGRL